MCFSLTWFEQMLIWLVVLCAIIAILKVLVPWVLSIAGILIPAPMLRIFNIFLWAVVAVFVIIISFDLIACLISMAGGFHLPKSG